MLALVFFASVAQADDKIVIAALGDSLTQGYGLPQWEGFVPVLQARLEADGLDVQINNGGVSGDTSVGGLERAEWVMAPNVDGMILALGANDMLRGFPPELVQKNLSEILRKAQGKGIEVLLVGVSATGNFGAEYAQAFEAVYPALAEDFDVPLYPDMFQAISRGRSLIEAQAYLQADGLHPNAEGITMIVEDILPHVADLVERSRN